MGGFYTTSDLADEVGVTTETVARWIREGRLPGSFRRGDRWRIPYKVAEGFMHAREADGAAEEVEGIAVRQAE